MSQYNEGTVSVTNGDATVTGSGTAFTDYVQAGDLFKLSGEDAFYTVASVTDDTHLELTANYAGTTAGGQNYQITTDFTPNYGFPEVHGGDLEWPVILTQTLRMIDEKMKELDDRIMALEP